MKIAVVGAGAGGLAAAHDLLRAGHEVVVFEASDQVGGLAGGFRQPHWNWSVEHYYHHWFASDEHVLGLIDELGWSDKVLFPWPITAAYHDGRFFALDGPLSYSFPQWNWLDRIPGAGTLARGYYAFRYPALSLIDTFRYGIAGISLLLAPSWKRFEKETAYKWLMRWMGKRNLEALWEPLLIGKFGPHYKEVNAAWFWARVKARTPRLGTFVGGFQAFMESLADRIKVEGGSIELNSAVHRVSQNENNGLTLQTEFGSQKFDQCLMTTSPAILAKVAPELPEDYLQQLLGLRSMGAVVLVLALRHQLSEQGFYWHNLPKAAGFPFLSLVEHTNFLPTEYFGGDHIVYCGDYLEVDHEYFTLSKDQLLERFLPALPKINSRFTPEWVTDSWLFRTSYAQPVPPIMHSRSIPEVETPIPGLWFASMSQVYPWDRGTNYAVEIARRTAKRMIAR
jgi:protoporphyrinogen oxidase